MAKHNKSEGIEIVRAIAALTVIYGHVFKFELLPRTPTVLLLPGQFATEAVMVFFVISGLVISLSSERLRGSSINTKDAISIYIKQSIRRIFPVYFIALALTVGVTVAINNSYVPTNQLIGNLFFLQTLQGYIVSPPEFNSPLWSLSFEMTFYLLFAISFLWKSFALTWTLLACVLCAILYPNPLIPSVVAHAWVVIAFSLPWLFGHHLARIYRQAPRLPLGFCVAIFAVGLVVSRCPLSENFYDPFRLFAFALCCCPLLLSIVQQDVDQPCVDNKILRGIVASLSIAASALVWATSISLISSKMAMIALLLLISFMPYSLVNQNLYRLYFLKSPLVYIGSISYALYAVHAPIIHILKQSISDSHTFSRFAIFLLTTVTLAHFLDRVMQPRLFPNRNR